MGNQCMDEKSLQQVFEENVIELALTISDQDSDFEMWCSSRGTEANFTCLLPKPIRLTGS